MKIQYFDNAATTMMKEEVLKEMLPYLTTQYGNPSSVYYLGRNAKKAIEDAREKVARAINAETAAKEIFFTGCGTESDNLAIKGVALSNRYKGNHIITSKIEHPAVLNTCRYLEKDGFDVTYLNVSQDGTVDLQELQSAITDKTILISIMFANNEIGTIEPIKEIGEIAKSKDIYFHTDAVQAVGNVKIDVKELNIDLLSMSAHKFYGPKGVGALYIKQGVEIEKIQEGGHQEKDKRAGTENAAGIVGLGKAIELVYENIDEYNEKLIDLRDYYIKEVGEKIPGVLLNGHRTRRLPGNANISFKNIPSEVLLLKLDEKGICASGGSACSSGSMLPSHVLLATGLPKELAMGALRTTFGDNNTKEDVDYLVESLVEIVSDLRK